MESPGLTTLVVAYDDVDIALSDYAALSSVRSEGQVGDYDASVIRRARTGHEIVATTIDPSHVDLRRGAGIGLVLGAAVSPLLAGPLLGAGMGVLMGDHVDRFDAFSHADLSEVERLVERQRRQPGCHRGAADEVPALSSAVPAGTPVEAHR